MVLDKHVRLYHDLVISLKARLEQETCDAEEEDDASNREEQEKLVELEESLASSGGGGGGHGRAESTTISAAGLDTASLLSDTPSSAQVVWAGGACGALSYESVDELRVAVQSLQRLHAELQAETRSLTARIEESRAAVESEKDGGSGGIDRDPVVSCLLGAAETWMSLTISQQAQPQEEGRERWDGGGGGVDSCLLALPASTTTRESPTCRRSVADGENTHNSGSGRRGRSQSGRKDRRKIPIIDSGTNKAGKIVTARGSAKSGAGGSAQQGVPHREQDRVDWRPSSFSETVQNSGGGGALAMATKTPLRCRELFYHLVDAFREYQTTTAANTSRGVGGDESVDGNEQGKAALLGANPSTAAAAAAVVSAAVPEDDGNGVADTLPPIGALPSGGGGGGGSGVPASDTLSVSVRTLCDFGPPERRSVSTQTIAKVGGNLTMHFSRDALLRE